MESSTALESLRQRLEQLPDPDLGRTLGELSAVHSLQLRDGRVELYLELIPPLQWVARRIEQSCRAVVEQVLPGAELELYVREKEVPRPLPSPVLPGVTNLIAVASGKGGVGKSTVAANIAVMLAQSGARVGLLDADIYGPSAPVLFGLQDAPLAARKDEQGRVIGIPHERFGIRIASMGFVMQRDQAAILRGPLLAGYFMTLVEQMDWGELDFLVFRPAPGHRRYPVDDGTEGAADGRCPGNHAARVGAGGPAAQRHDVPPCQRRAPGGCGEHELLPLPQLRACRTPLRRRWRCPAGSGARYSLPGRAPTGWTPAARRR
jgi:metal-sulfur cluster biosynthetic enzyme